MSRRPTDPPVLAYAESTTRNCPLALASFVCGMVTLPGFVPCLCLVLYTPLAALAAVGAIVCGIMALRAIRRNDREYKGLPLAIIGIVAGGLLLLEYMVFLGILGLAILTGPGP